MTILKKIISACRIRVLLILDSILLSFIATRESKHDILLIRTDGIGDFILWLNTADKYKTLYPNKKIILLADSAWSNFAKNFPFWDEVWTVNRRRLKSFSVYRWKILFRIKRAGFFHAIHPSFSRIILEGDSIIRASNAVERIGFDGDTSNITPAHKKLSNAWYTKLVPATKEPLMELDRNEEFVRFLDPQYTRKRTATLLPKLSCKYLEVISKEYIVVFPGASWQGRQWTPFQFATVVSKLQQETNLQPIICGGPNDAHACNALQNLLSLEASFNTCGKTSLNDLVEIIRNSRLVLGNETSAIHIAAILNIPSVCISGGGHFGRFIPYSHGYPLTNPSAIIHKMSCYGCSWICNQSHKKNEPVPCIHNVKEYDVLAECMRIIKK